MDDKITVIITAEVAVPKGITENELVGYVKKWCDNQCVVNIKEARLDKRREVDARAWFWRIYILLMGGAIIWMIR